MADKIFITVIGEICEDVYVYGESKRLSPEAPVPILIPHTVVKNSGMCGNTANNLIALDKEVIIRLFHQEKPITKTRYIDDKTNHMFMRIDEGDNDVERFVITDYASECIEKSDVVVISDYNKGFLCDDMLIKIGDLAKLVIMDTKRPLIPEVVNAFNFLKVNEDEYERNKRVLDKFIHKTIITLGKRGVKYLGEIIPSPDPKETIDVSGAGDTFTAAFTLKYYETNDIKRSIIYANNMASIVVSKRGVATP